MSNFQDHPIDESTSVQPQHFDADGYKIGQPHREMLVEHETPDPVVPLGQFPDETPPLIGAAHDTSEADAPDGQFHDQEMPTTDGELSDPDPQGGLADRET